MDSQRRDAIVFLIFVRSKSVKSPAPRPKIIVKMFHAKNTLEIPAGAETGAAAACAGAAAGAADGT